MVLRYPAFAVLRAVNNRPHDNFRAALKHFIHDDARVFEFFKGRALAQSSPLMFFSRTTRPQRSSSSRKSLANSATEVEAGTAPDWISFARMSGAASAVMTASCSLPTTATGVRAGASKPYQLSALVSGKPCSASVGTSGNAMLRLAEAAPSGRILPP